MSDADSGMSSTAEGESSQREQNILWGNLNEQTKENWLWLILGTHVWGSPESISKDVLAFKVLREIPQIYPYRKHACWGHSFMILFTVMAIFL